MRIRSVVVFALASSLVFSTYSLAQGARLKLDLGNLASRAKENVNISIDKSTMDWALQGLNSKGADAEQIRGLMKDLEAITVQSLKFEKEKAPAWDEIMEAAKGVLQQIDGPQWKSLVSVTGKEASGPQIVRVSLFKDAAGEMGGMAVLAIQPTEVTLVNIAGKIKLDQMEAIGKALGKPGMFGPLGSAKKEPQSKEQAK
jgi:hypothetical protein